MAILYVRQHGRAIRTCVYLYVDGCAHMGYWYPSSYRAIKRLERAHRKWNRDNITAEHIRRGIVDPKGLVPVLGEGLEPWPSSS